MVRAAVLQESHEVIAEDTGPLPEAEVCLTQCEGDVITHAQQLAETHRASVFVYPQLCHPGEDIHNDCTVVKVKGVSNKFEWQYVQGRTGGF